MDPSQERLELHRPTIFGVAPDPELPLLEQRGGRFLPAIKTSHEELKTLIKLSEIQMNPDTLMIDFFTLPQPKQLARIAFFNELGCWDLSTYQDQKKRARYGQLSVSGIKNPSNLAHRTMYQVFFGSESLPNGRYDFLDHICERKSCCYPRHLERVTHKENTRRGRVAVSPGVIEPLNIFNQSY